MDAVVEHDFVAATCYQFVTKRRDAEVAEGSAEIFCFQRYPFNRIYERDNARRDRDASGDIRPGC